MNDLKEAERGLPMGVTRERREGSSLWLQLLKPSLALPLLVGSRAVGSTLKPCVPPFSRILPFAEVYTQATQEAGDTLDLQSWVKVVQTAKGQSQRGSNTMSPSNRPPLPPSLTVIMFH